MSMDIRRRGQWGPFDWRTKWRLGFYHYGVWRYFRIGKLGVQLWRLS
jgi:hypothetical protein